MNVMNDSALKFRLAAGSAILLYLFASVARSQSQASIPVPEYFGIYAVSDGQLIKLDGKEIRASKNVSVRMGQRTAVSAVLSGSPVASSQTASVPVFSPDLKIVVFIQTGGMISPLQAAEPLHIQPLVFVRNLSVDTGFPNNVRRSGPENGWEYGNAPELLGLATGDHPESLELLKKPFPGQKDMVVAGFANKLEPGVYRFTLQEGSGLPGLNDAAFFTFAVEPVAQAESSKCADATVTYAMMVSNVKYRPCSSQQMTPGAGGGATGGGSPGNTAGAPSCSDYNSCFSAGMAAYRKRDWGGASTAFESATKYSPSNAQPWLWLGRVYLQDGRMSDVPQAWDKTISLGGTLMIGACHEKTMRPCERGDLSVSAKSVSFLVNGSQPVFTASPNEITPGKVLNNSAAMHIAYNFQIGKNRYAIDFIPMNVQCTFNMMVQCPEDGISQQLTLANYVSQTLPKLANGTLTATVAPSAPAPSSLPSPTVPPSNSCSQAVDSGYAILLQGHLYKVKAAGATGPNQKVFFFDEKGTQVTDSNVLQQLASGAWTRDNVVVPPDARNGSSRVSAILGTSKALQTYTTVQDVLSRAMVEAIEAGVTGGASLSKAVPNLTLGVVKSQLMNAPMTLLTLASQHGLEASLNSYRQLEGLPLPPADSTALNGTDLIRVRDIYFQARSLELPYGAMAAKLMPTSGAELTEQALKSALSEVLAGPVFSGAPSDTLTLQRLLDLQKGIANLNTSLPALKAYSENLNLALNLTKANTQTIATLATAAAQKCN